MPNNDTQSSFTSKQNKLINIAKLSKFASWLILAASILSVGGKIYGDLRAFPLFEFSVDNLPGHINYYSSQFLTLFRGFGFWAILQGISLCLNMVVEIDFNVDDLKNQTTVTPESSTKDENPAVFYEPNRVFKLEGVINKALIFIVFLIVINSLASLPTTQQIVLSFFRMNLDYSIISWIIAIVIFVVAVTLQGVVYYFSFKSLGEIMLTIMEIEFNTRNVTK